MKKNIFTILKKRTNILILINSILLLCLIILYIPKKNSEILNFSLLLKNDIDSIEEIILTVPNKSMPLTFNELKLSRKNNNFVYKTERGEYKIKDGTVERLFSVLSAKKDFIFISNNLNQHHNLGLDEHEAIKLQLVRFDKTILKEFIFGKKDTLGSSIYFLPDARTKVFKMHDDISPFLTLRKDFWIDLQIYKPLFEQNKIQSIIKNNLHIIRSNKTEENFLKLETFLKQFSCIDIFPAMPIISTDTEYIDVILGNGEKISLRETPLENGDYILFDSKFANSYIISGYTKRRIDEIINNIF